MEPFISKKLQNLQPYDPDIESSAIHLDANESFLQLPLAMKRAIAEQVQKVAFNRYPDPLATQACAAFGSFYGVPQRLVTAGNGSDELITVIMNSFVDKGGKILFTRPDFSMYAFYCASYECVPVVVGKGDDLSFDPDELIKRAVDEKVSLIIFSNPCNPTAQGISRDAVLKIVRSVPCVTVVDEAYMDFWDQSVLDAAESAQNLIVLKTCSKIGFAASRMGFAVANENLTGYLRAAKSPYNVNSLTQAAAQVFLNDKEFLSRSVGEIRASRDSLYQALKILEEKFPGKIHVFPSHTNFIRVQSVESGRIHSQLRQYGISVRLSSQDALRITAGAPEENQAFLKAFEQILINLK